MHSVLLPNIVEELRLSICDAVDFRQSAELVLTAALQLPHIDAVGIYAFDAHGDFHLVSSAGVSDSFANLFRYFPASSSQVQMVQQGAPLYRRCVELPPERAALYCREGLTAIAIYPIRLEQRVVGSLHLGTRQLPDIPPELSGQIEVFVSSLANTIARIALEATVHRAYEEVEVKVQERTAELQAANRTICESEQKFRMLAESSQVMIAIVRDWRFLYVNPRLIAASGYLREELLALDVLQLFPAELRGLAYERAKRRLSGQSMGRSFEYPIRTKDGQTRWVEITAVRIDYQSAPALAAVATDITERKRAEQALRESEQRFASFMRCLPGAAWIKDLQGRYVYINPEAERVFGASLAQIRLKADGEVFPPEVAQQFRDNDARALAEGLQVQTVEVLRQPDGREHHSIVSKFALMDTAGKPAYIAGVAFDITERRLAEERLREHTWRLEVLSEISGTLLTSEHTPEILKTIFERISERLGLDVYLHYRADADNTGLNLCAWGGLTESQVAPVRNLPLGTQVCGTVAQRRTRIYLPDVRHSSEPNTELLRELALQAYVCHPLLANERLVGTLSFGSRHSDQFSEDTLALLRTISDQIAIAIVRHDAEEALHVSEARFRQLADAMPQLVWTAQPDGCMDYCNQRVEEYEGVVRGPGCIWLWEASVHPEDLVSTRLARDRALQSGQTFQVQHRLRMRSGEYRWHLSRAKPYRDESGRVLKWYGTTTDIQEQRAVQEALEDAQRRKDDFIAMLGHELRNPLAPIRNAVHLLKLAQLSDPLLQRSQEMIERQVSHMARLIDDLLDVSRISRGKIQLRKTRLDLTQVLRRCAEDYRPLVEGSGLRLQVWLPDKPVWIHGDAARLEQVVCNLLNNSLKFTDPGGTITVRLDAGPDEAEILVHDTGIGMEPQMLGRIFESFSQAEGTLDRSRGGLGLGLALVKGLTELHGGKVQAESPGTGLGAAFRIRLPLEASSEASVAEQPLPQAAKAEQPLRVLVIEDNLDAAESLEMLLSAFGHQVAVAHSGVEGVQKARAFQPEVTLCDIGLPGSMDGYAVARELRRDRAFESVYLIAMTGYGQDEDRRLAHEAGFDYHLTKPVDPQVLERLLRR